MRVRVRDVVAGAVVGAVVASATTAGALVAFSDVPDGHPFEEDIEWMAATGISEGYDDNTFRPTNPVSRQAMAAFMRRLAGVDPDVAPVVDAASVGGLAPEDIGWHGTAVVGDDGVMARGTATSSQRTSNGTYRVYFGRDLSTCTYQATVATIAAGSVSGFVTAARLSTDATAVFVRTFDAAGSIDDRPFHLTVIC